MIADVEKGDYIAVVNDAASLVNELPEDLKDCEAVQDDVTKIKDWFESNVQNPEQVAINVVTNI